MTCRTCGREQKRPHRHGDRALQMRIRYGRFVADQERDLIRRLFAKATRTNDKAWTTHL